jgi:hypothetical protein
MAMLHIHAYPCRPPEDIELPINPGHRGRISRRVVRSLRYHVVSPFMPPPVAYPARASQANGGEFAEVEALGRAADSARQGSARARCE